MPTSTLPKPSIAPANYTFLQQWIQRASGIVIDANKQYLLESRLTPIVEREGLSGIDELCSHLRSSTLGLAKKVVEAMTTHETLFFRDNGPFEALRHKLIPELLKQRPRDHRLAIWSAAASSGQEAYSLAITLLEMGLTSSEFSILGTDLSEKVLDRARQGTYGNFEVSRGLPADYLARYFDRRNDEFHVRPHVRQIVRFEQLDLRQPLHGRGPFDIVLCRNVLIYFDPPTKAAILREVHAAMSRGGYLLLGAAETVGTLAPGFRRLQTTDAIAYTAD